MDICMKRPDYNRFLQIADQIMPEGYKIFNISSDEDNDNMLTRIINGEQLILRRHIWKNIMDFHMLQE